MSFFMEPKYTCSLCKRKFSRKWNAFRHNIRVHADLSKIVLGSNNSSRSINHSKYMSNTHKKKFYKYKYLQSIYKSQDTDDYLLDQLIEETYKIDSKILKIIGQMIKPYLELEASLNYMTPKDKATVLSRSFLITNFL